MLLQYDIHVGRYYKILQTHIYQSEAHTQLSNYIFMFKYVFRNGTQTIFSKTVDVLNSAWIL